MLSDALRLLPAASKCLVELKGDDMSMVPLLQVPCWEPFRNLAVLRLLFNF